MSDPTTTNAPLPTAAHATYSTGELAQACGVTVRTVQYYDEKSLLSPSAHTEGGRRLYSEADAARLRRILLLKSLGLRLADIRSVLASDVSTTVLRDILEAQDARLARELQERSLARQRIATMIASLDTTGELPAQTIPDMEAIMQNTATPTTNTTPQPAPERPSMWKSELAPFYKTMLVVGIAIDVVQVAAIVWWVTTGDWRPFAIVMPLALAAAALLVRAYRAHTAYLCPHCRRAFVPRAAEWFFARHTPTTRRVTCTHCHTKDWCAEVSIDRLNA
ncbi:MerR family transcriptional regulator [Olsenella intestinalis]|uniref:MerR family transcriptional regulator n=1 Tax=Olsenella intestinalis TaxID=2930083 RepID=UPI002010B208|nr:MerR family transcriptional regulator [Olsenella intestinalis]